MTASLIDRVRELGDQIREGVAEKVEVTPDDIDWVGPGRLISNQTRRTITEKLKGDLEISDDEYDTIVAEAKKDEKELVGALLSNLQENSPKAARIGYLQYLLAQPGCYRPISWVWSCVAYSDKEAFRKELRERLKPLDVNNPLKASNK